MSFIYVDADHRGYKFKKRLLEFLRDEGFEVMDLGKKEIDEDDDYSDISIKLAEKVVKDNTKGILVCDQAYQHLFFHLENRHLIK